MRRREFVAAGGSCLCATLAGCAEMESLVSSGDSEPRHPFADSTVTVRIENESTTDHDVERNAREALEFWEAESTEYVDFEIEFELVDEDPDMILRYRDDPSGCENVEGFSENVLGCAPVIRPGNRAPEPTVARVVAADRPFGKIRITAKHEIGHVLGLGHDDTPRHIMSDRPEDRIPLYDVRIDIWETVLDAWEQGGDATRTFSEGGSAWSEEEYVEAAALYEQAADMYAEARDWYAHSRERTAEFEGHERVETVALENLRAHLDRLISRMESGVEFASLMAEAAEFLDENDPESANDRIRSANDAIDEFNQPPQPEPRDIGVALGLVRSFDREDETVTVEGEDD